MRPADGSSGDGCWEGVSRVLGWDDVKRRIEANSALPSVLKRIAGYGQLPELCNCSMTGSRRAIAPESYPPSWARACVAFRTKRSWASLPAARSEKFEVGKFGPISGANLPCVAARPAICLMMGELRFLGRIWVWSQGALKSPWRLATAPLYLARGASWRLAGKADSADMTSGFEDHPWTTLHSADRTATSAAFPNSPTCRRYKSPHPMSASMITVPEVPRPSTSKRGAIQSCFHLRCGPSHCARSSSP